MNSTIKSGGLVALMSFFMTLSSFAQTNRFSISLNSLTTNFNYGKSNEELQSYKKNFRGLQAGFAYQAGISPLFSVAPEIYFAIKGGTLKESNPLTIGKSTLQVYSLELPILARLHCKNLFLNAGPYAGYNLGGRLKMKDVETGQTTNTKINFGKAKSDFKNWDYGFQAGAGYNINMKKSVLTLDLRYGYGMANISNNVKRFNRMLNISVKVSALAEKSSKKAEG